MPNKIDPAAKQKSRLTKEEWREYTKTVWQIANTSHPVHPAVFPIEIPRRLIKLFSFHGETVLDPFAGTGISADAAVELGRRAICVEQNPTYVKLINAKHILKGAKAGPNGVVQTVKGDSRDLKFLPEKSVQLVVTSPPYWDKANYGKNNSNLGAIGNYRSFLDEMSRVFAECFRVLEPGRKMCVVTANVNQHTDYGLLTFPLSTDFTLRLRDAGFVLVNEIIWSKDGTGGKWGSANKQRPIFGSYPYPPNFLFKNVHEYVIIAAKPPSTKTKGPKVKNYADLTGRS